MHLQKILVSCCTALAVIASSGAWALDVNDEPLTEKWAPSEWGADDKIGAANRTTPEMILKSIGLVKKGKVATLGKVYTQDMPTFGVRAYKMTIRGMPTGGPFGPQKLIYMDEVLSTEIGQVGTQFDGPGHIGVLTSKGLWFYNGYSPTSNPAINSNGMGPLGVEFIAEKGFVCRGVVLDAVALRGGQLPIPKANDPSDPGIITEADIKEMIKRQGIAPIGEGDCVFLHTGHGDLWSPTEWDKFDTKEKARRSALFNSGEPGFGAAACEYLASRKIILTGADSWGTDAVGPGFGGETPQPFECHIKLQTKRGIWNLENLNLNQLVDDKAYEFLFVWAPLKLKGATGSPANPVALY